MKPSLAALWMTLLPALGAPGEARAENSSTKIEVFVDRSKTPLVGDKLIVPSEALEVRFFVTPRPGQVRYKLHGWDLDWQQRVGPMFFIVRYLNAEKDMIGQDQFEMSGMSPGWNGDLEHSTYTARAVTVEPPPLSVYLSIGISTAGPSAAVGFLAVRNITVAALDEPGGQREVLLENSLLPDVEPPRTLHWQRGGTAASMASISYPENPGESPTLILEDNNITAHADWLSVADDDLKVVPGKALQISWEEVYSTGMGDPLSAFYGRIAPGTYTFEVEEVGLTGDALKRASLVTIKVPLPLWHNPWFWSGCAAAAALLATLWGRYIVRKRIRLHLQQTQLIQEERMRIARDLHDDLGARLSHISLLGSHAESSIVETAARESFRQITAMSRELMSALSETVWMLNFKNDRLDSLIEFLCRMVSELCKPTHIRCRIDAVSVPDDIPIPSEIRHNTTLAVKEAVTNAIKHSQATEIRLQALFEPPFLKVSITDNGTGIEAHQSARGNGLRNIRQRMEAIGGTCSICDAPETGTSIIFHVPIR